MRLLTPLLAGMLVAISAAAALAAAPVGRTWTGPAVPLTDRTPAPRPAEPPVPSSAADSSEPPGTSRLAGGKQPSASNTLAAPASAAATTAPSSPSLRAPPTPALAFPAPPAAAAAQSALAALAAPPPLDAGDRRLRRRLERLIDRTDIDGSLAVTVLDEEFAPIFAVAGTRPRLPASTQKLFVAAGSLARLGAGHRFSTRVLATAPPDRSGTVRGDLLLVGGGDPALASPAFARLRTDRPATSMALLAKRIRRAGVVRVTGRILADPSVFADQPLARGWPPRYVSNLDATHVSGLTVDAGQRLFSSRGRLHAVAAADPALQAALVLRQLLARRGVRVVRGVSRSNRPATGFFVAKVRSPPLVDLLRYLTQQSDNALADGVFRAVGADAGQPTWAGAARATRHGLAPLRLPWSAAILADGSGLSRRDRVSSKLLATLQARMWHSREGRRWRSLLAVAGASGTLRWRLRGTVAERRLHGKTGTLRDVRALTGTVVGPGGRVAHLAVIGNRLAPGSTLRTTQLIDRIVVETAEQLYGCRPVSRRSGANGQSRRQTPRLRCAQATDGGAGAKARLHR